MRRRCTMDDTLWTRPFVASYLGMSVSSVQKLMMNGTLPYCFPFPDNDHDVRLFREDVIAYRDLLREGALARVRAAKQRASQIETSYNNFIRRRNV